MAGCSDSRWPEHAGNNPQTYFTKPFLETQKCYNTIEVALNLILPSDLLCVPLDQKIFCLGHVWCLVVDTSGKHLFMLCIVHIHWMGKCIVKSLKMHSNSHNKQYGIYFHEYSQFRRKAFSSMSWQMLYTSFSLTCIRRKISRVAKNVKRKNIF